MASAKPIEYVVRLKDLASTGLNRIGKNAKKAANEAKGAFAKAEAQLKKFGKAAVAAVSATFLVGLAKGVARAREFEKAMAEVNTILGAGSMSIGAATKQVEQLALELGKPAPELAAGMYQTLSAGVTDSTQALILLEGAARAGIAGLSTTTEAVDLLTTKFNAYGETVTEEAVAATNDLIFKTIQLGKTTMPELSASLGQILPTAAQLGVPFEDVAAALATLTLKGVSTSEAVTQLNAIFTAFLRKGEQAQKDFPEFANLMGANAIKSKGFRDAIVDLKNAMDGSEDALQGLMGRTEGVKAVLSLTAGEAKVLDKQMELIADSAGAADRAFAIMSDTVDAKLRVAVEGITQGFAELGGQIAQTATGGETDFEGMVSQAEAFKTAIKGLMPIVNLIGLTVGTIMTGILGVFTAVQGSIYLIGKAMNAMGLIADETFGDIQESTAGMTTAFVASAEMTQNFGRDLIGLESTGGAATQAMADLTQQIKDANSGMAEFERDMGDQTRKIIRYMHDVEAGTMPEEEMHRAIQKAYDTYVKRAKQLNIELPQQVESWKGILDRAREFEGEVKDAAEATVELTQETENFAEAVARFPDFGGDEYNRRVRLAAGIMAYEHDVLMLKMEEGEEKQIAMLMRRRDLDRQSMLARLSGLGFEEEKVREMMADFTALRDAQLDADIQKLRETNREKEAETRRSARREALARKREFEKASPAMKAAVANPILGALVLGVTAARDAAKKIANEFAGLMGGELAQTVGGSVGALESYFTVTPQMELDFVNEQIAGAKAQVAGLLGTGAISEMQAEDINAMIANVEKYSLAELEAAAANQAFTESLEGQNVALRGARMGLKQFADQIPDLDQQLADITSKSLNNFAAGLTQAFMAIGDGSKSAKEAFKEFAVSFIKQTAAMIVQMLILQGLKVAFGFGLADGGIAEGGTTEVAALATGGVVKGGLGRALPVKGYAMGGPIVSGPHLALIGEGKHNEAVVPLPDGRSIPVTMNGGGGTNVNFSISAVDARGVDELLVERQETIRGLIRQAMTEDRLFRQTFGGSR